MPFAAGAGFQEAAKQLDELRPDFLLLVDALASVEIDIAGRSPRVLSSHGDDQRKAIREGAVEVGAWRVHRREEALPEEFVGEIKGKKARFKMSVALPEKAGTGAGRLYCFFPTDAELPLPLLAHATLDLDQTRKHVNDLPANKYILRRLAEVIAEAAEEEAATGGVDRWRGARLVVASSAWAGDLVRLGFVSSLGEAAKRRKLVPTVNAAHELVGAVRLAPGGGAAQWPERFVSEMAAVLGPDEYRLAKLLGVEELAYQEILERVLAAPDLSIEERASVIAGVLLVDRDPKDLRLPSLLIDERGVVLAADDKAILQPTGEQPPPLPSWARMRFLHPELRTQLARLLGVTEVRELTRSLRPFGVTEYSLAALIGPVLAEGNRRAASDETAAGAVRSEVLRFLAGIYARDRGRTLFPNATLKLPNQAGGWTAPGQLYLGNGYGQDGRVAQDLYQGWAREKLVVEPEALGLGEKIPDVGGFLRWLGVAQWPRSLVLESAPLAYREEVRARLTYPAIFEDTQFENADALADATMAEVISVDGLEQILEGAQPEAILAWLARDPRSLAWEQISEAHGKVKIRPYRAHVDREYGGPIPSYVRWRIATTAWLPTVSGLKPPRSCMLGDRLLDALFPKPKDPDTALSDRYGITEQLFSSFTRAGVLPGLAQMGHDELYRLLLEAPDLDPSGNASMALCRWLLNNDASIVTGGGTYKARFFKWGWLWGRKAGAARFFPLKELHHLDFEGVPEALVREIAIAHLPKRVVEKVRNLLGVIPLERAKISETLVSVRKSASHDIWRDWFAVARPLVVRLREAQTKQPQALERVKNLELWVCDELIVRMEYEGVVVEHVAREGDYFLFPDGLYLKGQAGLPKDLIAAAAGQAVAGIFDLTDGAPFAAILRCDEASRRALLRHMIGDSFQDVIEDAVQAPQTGYSGPIRVATEAASPSDGQNGSESEIAPQGDDDGSATAGDGSEKEPGIRMLPHIPKVARKPAALVVRKVKPRSAVAFTRTNVVSGDHCEEMAMKFEECGETRRYPLRVGDLKGTAAPGCDILSFASAAAREAFEKAETRDWSTVVRFIEVKGRSNSTAKIDLKGNELSAAQRYRERYFLYRFYEQQPGEFVVSTLQNPMDATEALDPVVEVSLEAAFSTRHFEFVVGGENVLPEAQGADS
jgi:hypothetical protein